MKSTKINVIQFGTGNFLRGFIEPIFQNLKNKGLADPRICIVESTGSGKAKSMAKSKFEYPIWTTGMDKGELINETLSIDCIAMGLSLPEDGKGFLELAKNQDLEWVISNVTEAGFVLESEEDMTKFPKSFPARLTRFLFDRFEYFKGDPQAGLQILPCELVEENGKKLRGMILGQAKKWRLDQAFLDWIVQENNFYTTLVDRIVPGKPSQKTLLKNDSTHLDHPFLVQAEPYFLLATQSDLSKELKLNIYESDFPVLSVESVQEYATRKVRVLNGSHIAMVVLGLPKGIETVSEFMADDSLFSELKEMIETEVLPYISQDQEELLDYSKAIWDRFRNPFVKHKLADISLNTITKLNPRIIDSIISFYEAEGRIPRKLTGVLISALVNYLDSPERIRDTDQVKAIFSEARKMKNPNEKADFLLSHSGLWNIDLRSFQGLKEALLGKLS
ncbi:tagaturonate reductase [Algoriphagus namhaensis]|uniref:Tagaturonate reductase n=1 Tax=Algoriphagus namhaensis TaxID=915353 RepID=A0ABV8AVY0_9BACT